MLNTEFIICNAEFIILNTQFIIFNTEFIIFNTESIIFNTESIICNTKCIICDTKCIVLMHNSSCLMQVGRKSHLTLRGEQRAVELKHVRQHLLEERLHRSLVPKCLKRPPRAPQR